MIQKGQPQPSLARQKKTYRVLAAGWIAGRWRAEGEEIEMTAAQAKYVNVEPVVPEPVASARRKPAGADAS
jgi:hypothetical protein